MDEGDYRQGVRAGVAAVVRGLLLVDADELDAGALVGSLSAYEALLDHWAQEGAAEAPAPVWQPTAGELGIETG